MILEHGNTKGNSCQRRTPIKIYHHMYVTLQMAKVEALTFSGQ